MPNDAGIYGNKIHPIQSKLKRPISFNQFTYKFLFIIECQVSSEPKMSLMFHLHVISKSTSRTARLLKIILI